VEVGTKHTATAPASGSSAQHTTKQHTTKQHTTNHKRKKEVTVQEQHSRGAVDHQLVKAVQWLLSTAAVKKLGTAVLY
jgi:hypothetical protein